MGREDEVRLIAYSIWEQEGCLDGKDCEHWYRAEFIWEGQQKKKAVTSVSSEPNRQSAKRNPKAPTAPKKPVNKKSK